MSEEMQDLFYELKQILVQYSPKWNTLCDIEKYIEQLQQENKELKEKLDISEANYDIIYDYFSQVNKLLGTELCEEAIEEILKLKRNNNILTEFERWLGKEKKKLDTSNEFDRYGRLIIIDCLDKLQELKRGEK